MCVNITNIVIILSLFFSYSPGMENTYRFVTDRSDSYIHDATSQIMKFNGFCRSAIIITLPISPEGKQPVLMTFPNGTVYFSHKSLFY